MALTFPDLTLIDGRWTVVDGTQKVVVQGNQWVRWFQVPKKRVFPKPPGCFPVPLSSSFSPLS